VFCVEQIGEQRPPVKVVACGEANSCMKDEEERNLALQF